MTSQKLTVQWKHDVPITSALMIVFKPLFICSSVCFQRSSFLQESLQYGKEKDATLQQGLEASSLQGALKSALCDVTKSARTSCALVCTALCEDFYDFSTTFGNAKATSFFFFLLQAINKGLTELGAPLEVET